MRQAKTVMEIDLLLADARDVPEAQRSTMWQSYVDALLERRTSALALARTQREVIETR